MHGKSVGIRGWLLYQEMKIVHVRFEMHLFDKALQEGNINSLLSLSFHCIS